MKKTLRALALLLMLALLLPVGAAAAEMPPEGMGMPPDGMMGPPPDGGAGGPGGPPGGGDGAPDTAAIVIRDGTEVPEDEYEPGAYSGLIVPEEETLTLEGLVLSSGDYTYNGLVATGQGTAVHLKNAEIHLGVDSPVEADSKGGSAVHVDDGAALYLSGSKLIVDGAARYVTAAYNDATLVVNDSLVQSTGMNDNTREIAEPFSNAALLISGDARANFSVGATQTYYFNSTCTAEGWAALSTDSAMGNGLDLYAYNTDGIAEHGGYGTYADTNCRVWLYGSRLNAAEIGAIISKSGRIMAWPAGAAEEDLLQYNEGETVEADTSIVGGRNAVMIHAPDMMGQGLWAADCGHFEAVGARIATDPDLQSTKDYYDYGDAVGAYIDYVSGSDFLIRSTSATIDLKDVEMESYNGTLIHTVLNADSMGNFLAPGDGLQVQPIWVHMEDMDVTGDIRHEDYQRWMNVELNHATLSGNIVSGTMASWNETWKDYGDVTWVVDEEYDAVYGVSLTMLEGSVWNVTGQSSLTGLTVAEGAVINGEITLDGEPLIPEPGVSYTGAITVTGDYVPEEEGPEEDPEATEESAQEPAPPAEPEPEVSAESVAQTPEASAPETETPETPAPETPAAPARTPVGLIAGIVIALAVICGAVVVLVRRRKK